MRLGFPAVQPRWLSRVVALVAAVTGLLTLTLDDHGLLTTFLAGDG